MEYQLMASEHMECNSAFGMEGYRMLLVQEEMGCRTRPCVVCSLRRIQDAVSDGVESSSRVAVSARVLRFHRHQVCG